MGLPVLGNILSLKVPDLHNQFYKMADQYGPIMRIYIFNVPIVIMNTADVCLEAFVKAGEYRSAKEQKVLLCFSEFCNVPERKKLMFLYVE